MTAKLDAYILTWGGSTCGFSEIKNLCMVYNHGSEAAVYHIIIYLFPQICSKALLPGHSQRLREWTVEDHRSDARPVPCYSGVRVRASRLIPATGAQRWWYSLATNARAHTVSCKFSMFFFLSTYLTLIFRHIEAMISLFLTYV